MELPKLKNGKWNYLAMSFAFPVVGMLLLMMVSGFAPFGKYSLLCYDMYHQYYPFFKTFREALRSGDSLLYTWDIGMGMDYLGLIAYYLASSFNLFTVFLPESWMLPYFSLLIPVKLGLAGLFFAFFLKKTFGKEDLSLSLFSCFYAMCAWALGYGWNIMWLDTFALLPLVAVGTVSLLRDQKFVLYTVSLSLSILFNYYIGLFTCIFVLLLFICYEICRWKGIVRFFSDLIRIALFSVLAIGMTAFLELPAFAALQTTQSSVNRFPDSFALNMVSSELCGVAKDAWAAYEETGGIGLWLTALVKSIPPVLEGMRIAAGNSNGGLAPSFLEGLPNLYTGVGTLILAFLFLTCKKAKLRDKLCSLGLLVFFILSFVVRQLDYIWHGFHFPNMIYYRFSFLFSFVLLYMAYRAFLLRRSFRLWQVLTAGALAVGVMLLSNDRSSPVFLAYNGVFFSLYLGVLVLHSWAPVLPKEASWALRRQEALARRNRRKVSGIFLSCVMLLELTLNLVNFGVHFVPAYVEDYPQGTKYTASMIRYMKEREEDNLFYRAETTHSQTLNDGALNGYRGISAFTSSANAKVTRWMEAMGYSAKDSYNRYLFEESSPVANLFLNLKYMLERQGAVEENPYFDTVHHYGDVYLLENNAYLPLGFLAESELAQVDFSESGNTFAFQNKLFSAATGLDAPVWEVPFDWLSVSAVGVEVLTDITAGFTSYRVGETAGTLTYTYTATGSGFFCLDMTMPEKNSISVWKNGIELYSESLTAPQTFAVSQVRPGDVIQVKIICKAGEYSNVNILGGILDDELFRRGVEILSRSTLELEVFENTRVEGTVDCDREGLLYTSVPQDGNWRAFVDGVEATPVLVGEAMLALPLTQGQHTIRLVYENVAFSLGCKISLACLLIFAGITLAVYYPQLKRRKGKYEN